MRLRILFGAAILIAGLTIYALLVVSVASIIPDHWAIQALFYAAAGIGWVPAAAKLTRWMQPPGRWGDTR